MAAILFLVAILGLLFAGRTQAQAVDGSKPLFSFQLWQLALALILPLVCAAADVPTIAKVVAVVSTGAAFSFSVFRARHVHDFDDLHF
ncbi:MAG TPA: hypothetical protein VK613_07430 [Gaiellaceae bacterium]|nr:hypothetical protein [Gaiellaceae bacterium]